MFDFRHQNWTAVAWISVWAIATVFAIGFCFSKFKLLPLYDLLTSGTQTFGTVTEKLPADHQRIRYSFQHQNQTYQWSGFAGDLDKTFAEVNVGESVPVTFETGNPVNSCLGAPEKTFYANLRLSIFISLFPTIAALLLFISEKLKSLNPAPLKADS